MQFAMQYILNFLECVSHMKTLQGLSNGGRKTVKICNKIKEKQDKY